MKAQTAQNVAGYTRAIVMVQISGKWMALDWIAMDSNAPYIRMA